MDRQIMRIGFVFHWTACTGLLFDTVLVNASPARALTSLPRCLWRVFIGCVTAALTWRHRDCYKSLGSFQGNDSKKWEVCHATIARLALTIILLNWLLFFFSLAHRVCVCVREWDLAFLCSADFFFSTPASADITTLTHARFMWMIWG